MGREKSREIIEKSKDRAKLLTDYLCNSTEGTFATRKKDFFVWFKQERYSWYAIMVLEECLKLAELPDSDVSDDLYIGMVVYLLGLYKENGRQKQYKELCHKTVLQFQNGKRNVREAQSIWLRNIIKITGMEPFEIKAQEVKAQTEEVAETKAVVTNTNRPFEEITASYILSKPLTASEECAKFFVGRDAWITDYCNRLRSGVEGILVFYGQYRVGKSSVLENLKYYLKDDFEVISPIDTDMTSKSSFR